MSSRKWSCWCAKAETVWQEQHPSMHFTCEWPFKDGGLQQAAKIWDRSRVDFDCGVLPIVRGCRSTSELHPVCCIRGLVFPTSRDCPCVQPAFILSWYSYTLRKTLCCGKESPKLTSRANQQRWNAYDDQCLDGPLLPRKELCWRTELSIELRQPLFNLSLNIILTFSACLSPLMCSADSRGAACLGRNAPSASLPLYPRCPAMHRGGLWPQFTKCLMDGKQLNSVSDMGHGLLNALSSGLKFWKNIGLIWHR